MNRDSLLLLLVCFETKRREATESTTISGREKPLEKGKCKATTESFEEHSNLFPA